VTPDLSIVPKKYHTFISPPLRRVFLDTREDNSRAVIKDLNVENAALKERVTLLERDKDLLTDRCNAAHSAVARLSDDEQTARLANYKARSDALKDKQNLNRLSAEYDALKSRARIRHGLALFLFFIFVSMKLYYSRSVGLPKSTQRAV
jgi:hypothetical protein